MTETLPSLFIERLQKIVPQKDIENVLMSFSRRKPTTFRINTLKTDENSLLKALTGQGFEIAESPIPGAFVLKNKTQRELTDTSEYQNGMLYIQGLSSMIPPLALDPQPKELILDACSAPGSKTTQIAALMENTGQIIANDMSRVRLYKLAANIKTLGVTNTQTVHMRAQDLWKKFPETFDRALVDVPCSLEGRFLSSNPKTYKNWSVKKIKVLSDHQKHILRSAVSSVKTGGTLIYSTCTLAPEENEAVVDWILSKESRLEIVPVTIPNIPTTPCLSAWEGETYHPSVKHCVRILPNDFFEGFFLAKFKKT